jgi:hypothetical protein
MPWLWLLVPVLLLGAAAALWRATVRLDHRRAALETELAVRRPHGPQPTHR